MTEWKWVRIPGTLHDRLTDIAGEVESERVQRERARTGIRYYEVLEMALDALERDRNHGVDRDDTGWAPGDAGHGNMDGVGDAGGT